LAGRKRLIDGQLLFMLAVLAALVAVGFWQGGGARVIEGLEGGGRLLVRIGLIVVVSLLVAGFAEVLVPKHWVQDALGEGSGLRGIATGVVAGAITPAGQYVAMPIAVVLLRSGAATAPVVAFLTAWSLLALHRLLAWEVPLLGVRFAATRWAICLLLPFLAGWVASFLQEKMRTP
jgi:uncharacterized membrane protein YraQ (UPF0718 family)